MFRDADGNPKKLWALSEKGDYEEMWSPDQVRATALYNGGKRWRFFNADADWNPPKPGTGTRPYPEGVKLETSSEVLHRGEPQIARDMDYHLDKVRQDTKFAKGIREVMAVPQAMYSAAPQAIPRPTLFSSSTQPGTAQPAPRPSASAVSASPNNTRPTLLSTGSLEDLPGRGVRKTQPPAPEPQNKPVHKMASLSGASAMHIGEDNELGRGVGAGIKKAMDIGGQSRERGKLNDRINKIYADKGMGLLTPEQKIELSRLESELAAMPGNPADEGFLAEMLRETLEGLGARQEDLKEFILGQDGSSRLTLGKDPVSKTGEYLFKRIKSDFGGNFRNLSNMQDPQGKPMDEDVARSGAVLVTAAELALEVFGGKILKSIPGADKAKKAILQRVVDAAMENDKIRAVVIQGSKQLVLRSAIKYV